MTHYLIADAHLFPPPAEHPGRERLLDFLGSLLEGEPAALWILGDLFDFWFEYRSVAPAGHWRVLSALRALTDAGWNVRALPGNHDSWLGGSFEEATGARVLPERIARAELAGRRAVLAHGDGLGPGDIGYRFLLRPVLRARLSAFLFGLLHPDLGRGLARLFSGTSRRILRRSVEELPPGLARWAEGELDSAELVVTAHTHVPVIRSLPGGIHLSLGDWIRSFSWARVDREGVALYCNGDLADSGPWPEGA